jgi:hypothetical protein
MLASIHKDKNMIIESIKKIFGIRKKETKQRDFEWERFQKTAKEQFQRLKDKGISIPVVTL